MNEDPKILLEAFRVDENEVIELQSTKYKKKKNLDVAKISNKAVLSVCLMTGITAGIGTANINTLAQSPVTNFDSVQENIPRPPDEPISNLPGQSQEESSKKEKKSEEKRVPREKLPEKTDLQMNRSAICQD